MFTGFPFKHLDGQNVRMPPQAARMLTECDAVRQFAIAMHTRADAARRLGGDADDQTLRRLLAVPRVRAEAAERQTGSGPDTSCGRPAIPMLADRGITQTEQLKQRQKLYESRRLFSFCIRYVCD